MKHAIFAAGLAALALPAPVLAQEIVLSVGSRGYGPVIPHVMDVMAEQHPDISIDWLKVPDVPNESRQIYVTNLIGESPTPDVFAVDVIWVGEFARRGWLEPLTGHVPDDLIAQYNESFMEAATVDGTPYAAPLYVDGTHLFYRADLLEKYGFEPPQTWEELIEQSKTIMEGEGPRMYGFVSMWAPIEGLFMNYLSFLGGAGGTFYDDAGELAIESAESVKALSTMVDILHEHQIAPDSILNMRPDDARLLFQQGRSAFLMVQDFAHGPLTAEDSPVRDAVAFKRNPVFEGNPEAHSTALGGWLLAINPFSEHKAAAGQLIAAMTSPELQTWAAVNEARAPGNQAVYDSEELAAMEGPLNGFVSNYAYGVVRPSAEAGQNYPRISEIMQAEITEALHRQKAPEEALADAARQIRAVTGE